MSPSSAPNFSQLYLVLYTVLLNRIARGTYLFTLDLARVQSGLLGYQCRIIPNVRVPGRAR